VTPTGPGWLGAVRHQLPRCGSTNDEALALARAGAPHGTVVTADEQTAGRGRAGRRWHSPPGDDLYLSAVLRPGQVGARSAAELPAITLAAGIGVCEAVRGAGVAAARLKWPNDVLVGDRKLAGILAETTGSGDAGALVLGIGVDVRSRRDRLPPELAAVATSLAEELGEAPAPAAFAERLLASLEPWLDRFFAGGVAAVAAAWEARASLERRVRVSVGGGEAEGRPRGLGPDGSLRVALDDGREVRVVAGDVLEVGSAG
jgi:BirA family biotin operon repressor/biotin-[acetyl-CoA-carboxylase] ligase